MRFIFLITILLSMSIQSQGLTTDVKSDENIYLFALKEYCNSSEISATQIYVQFDSMVMWHDWPKKINNININYLHGSSEILKQIKANKGSIKLINIVPLQYEKEQYFVNVIPFLATAKGKKIYMSNSGGLRVIFKYIDEIKGFVLSKN